MGGQCPARSLFVVDDVWSICGSYGSFPRGSGGNTRPLFLWNCNSIGRERDVNLGRGRVEVVHFLVLEVRILPVPF
ncbi:hypothetical protein LCGC14_0143270 [marine sediment metagenome]|uniref:Uncharacterized protein n=1 Tax=marine sediment metagenome TaxID=412755 RepID=A0A0F9V4Z9_9ZZZZ